MIDFSDYKKVLLEEVATFERAKKGKIYLAGTSTIQISATSGEIGYLREAGEVATKNAVVFPKENIAPRYFNIVLEKNIEAFTHKYATGINVQESVIGKFPLEIHSNKETQEAIVKIIDVAERGVKIVESEICAYKKIKECALDKMLVEQSDGGKHYSDDDIVVFDNHKEERETMTQIDLFDYLGSVTRGD